MPIRDISPRPPPAPLGAVLITAELERRPARSPEFQAESEALVRLTKVLKEPSADVLQALAETALQLCRAHSAGIVIEEEENGCKVFRWHGVAGRWSGFLPMSMPREASPCATVVDRNAPLLMAYPERHFTCPIPGVPPLVEVLLVPFQIQGITAGAVCVVAHDETRPFDREDLRLLTTLSEFASVGYHVVQQAARIKDALDKELAGSQLLQSISAGLVGQNDIGTLYERILDAATVIMRAEFASMQLLRNESELQLLAWRGFHPRSAQLWRQITLDSTTTCGMALRNGQRFVIADTEKSDLLAGTPHLDEFRRSCIRSAQSTPLTSGSGQIIGVLSTHWRRPHQPTSSELRLFDVLARLAADLLERAKIEQALRDSDRRKDEFLAVLGHELRNPLAPLSTGLELLRRADKNPELVDNVHSMMSRQLSHLMRLVDDLLDLSRITHGKIELQRAPLDLRVVIEAALELSKPLIDQRQHELFVEPAPFVLSVHGDLERLAQVLANVLSNAAKYMEPCGRIDVRSEALDGEAVVRIRDRGFGIPADQLESVFEMFSQVREHQARGGGSGLGIGLALSRELITLHGGSIAAFSEGLGHGTELVIRLPLDCPANAVEAPVVKKIDSAKVPRRVLIVDDNVDAADSLCAALQLLGHTAQATHDAPSALALLETFTPAVLLLDIGLPRLDGYELAHLVRATKGGESLVLIAITGWGLERDRIRAREAGFDHHLTKPVKLEVLQAVLDGAPA